MATVANVNNIRMCGEVKHRQCLTLRLDISLVSFLDKLDTEHKLYS